MLPPFIIEQIKKREEERQQRSFPRLELPLPEPLPRRRHSVPDEEENRGVIVIELV